jgi:hypothetical protein
MSTRNTGTVTPPAKTPTSTSGGFVRPGPLVPVPGGGLVPAPGGPLAPNRQVMRPIRLDTLRGQFTLLVI